MEDDDTDGLGGALAPAGVRRRRVRPSPLPQAVLLARHGDRGRAPEVLAWMWLWHTHACENEATHLAFEPDAAEVTATIPLLRRDPF